MEIFNIHIFEFLLIAGLALVVFGPERLPEVGRFIGKQVARFLAWQQQSPELKMLNDIRGEFESEIANLRDELTRTRKELDVQQEMAALREELKPMLDLRNDINPPAGVANAAADTAQNAIGTANAAVDAATPSIAPPQLTDPIDAFQQLAPEIKPAGQAVPASTRPNRIVAAEPTNVLKLPAAPESEAVVDPPTNAAPEPAPDAPALDAAPEPAPNAAPEPAPDAPALDAAPDAGAGASAPQTGDIQPPEALASGPDTLLLQRIDTLSAELQALIAILHDRGVLDTDWRPTIAMHDEEHVA